MTAPRQGAATSSQAFRIELFGAFRIAKDDQPLTTLNKPRLQALLAYLILHGDTPQSREQLSFLIWPDSGEAQARTNFRQLLHHLRHALPAECGFITTDHQTVQWRAAPGCAVDVVEFDAAIAMAESAATSGDTASEYELLKKAASLYQDDLLPALYDEWLQSTRNDYRQKAAQMLARLASLLEQRRDYRGAIGYAERLVALDQLSEAHHQRLIRLHYRNGDRASALRAYHQCMRTLRRELGVEPGAATRELFEHALKTDSSMDLAGRSGQESLEPAAALIGRNLEWQTLTERWNTASAGGSHLVVIVGEPGIGKSRLAEELYVRCKQAQCSTARARCYAAQGRLAFAPIAEWLRTEPLRAAWSQLPPAQTAELARVLPEILTTNPSIARPQALTEGWERRLFYDALNAAFFKAPKPLLLVIDDLQWCDQDTFEWLHSFFHADLGGGILVVGTVRSGDTDRDHPFTRLFGELRQSSQASEIPLLPLDAADTASLGRQVAGRGLGEAELTRLYRATQGNPLFVVETVRAGIEETSGSAAALPRVRAVIVARFAQLSASAYELVGFAGAIGQAFSYDVLAKATDWDEESLARALEELWHRRIMVRNTAGRYDFTHDLLREVAYAELSPVRKRFLHRRVARALQETHTADIETVAGQMAAHCVSGDLAEDAIRYYRMAARAAHQRYADREAAAELHRAVALCRDLPASAARKRQELDLLVDLERTLLTTLGYAAPEVGEASQRAIALFRDLSAVDQGLPVISTAWVFHVVRGDFATAKRLADELWEHAGRENRTVSTMAAHFALGSVHFHLGNFNLSQEGLENARAHISRCSSADLTLFATPEIRVFCDAYIPHVLWHVGYADLALSGSQEAVASAGNTHPFGLAIALVYAAMLHVFRDEQDQAVALADEAAAVCSRFDIAYYSSMAHIIAGWSRAMRGDTISGLPQLRQGIESLRATGAELRAPFYYALLAQAYGRAGMPGEALANISNGLAFQNKNGELWAAPYLHLTHGDVLLQGGSRTQALGSFLRALESAQQIGAPLLAIRAALRICRTGTDQQRARATLQELCSRLTEGFDTRDVREARSLLTAEASQVMPE